MLQTFDFRHAIIGMISKLRRRQIMKKTGSLRISLRVTLATIAYVGSLAGLASASAPASSAATTTTVPPTTTTAPPTTSAGLITVGPSRTECLTPDVVGSGLGALQGAITKFNRLTQTSVSCVSAYLNGARTWSEWEHPWIAQSQFGYSSWVAQAPQSRELVLQVDLIPLSLRNVNNPINWERSCAAGKFDAHATLLATNLIAAGLQNTVIRLGAEMNGNWETDFVGTTSAEQRLWVRCFENEVVGLRHATGEHFLIDWNPNPCRYNIPYTNLYPGNSFVDILGLDLFDQSCIAPQTRYSFAQLANQPSGLASFETFAREHRKPMSLPEWGLAVIPSGDDPQYIDGIGSNFDSRDFAFETYFDVSGKRIKTLALGPRTPLSVPAFVRWFGSGVRP